MSDIDTQDGLTGNLFAMASTVVAGVTVIPGFALWLRSLKMVEYRKDPARTWVVALRTALSLHCVMAISHTAGMGVAAFRDPDKADSVVDEISYRALLILSYVATLVCLTSVFMVLVELCHGIRLVTKQINDDARSKVAELGAQVEHSSSIAGVIGEWLRRSARRVAYAISTVLVGFSFALLVTLSLSLHETWRGGRKGLETDEFRVSRLAIISIVFEILYRSATFACSMVMVFYAVRAKYKARGNSRVHYASIILVLATFAWLVVTVWILASTSFFYFDSDDDYLGFMVGPKANLLLLNTIFTHIPTLAILAIVYVLAGKDPSQYRSLWSDDQTQSIIDAEVPATELPSAMSDQRTGQTHMSSQQTVVDPGGAAHVKELDAAPICVELPHGSQAWELQTSQPSEPADSVQTTSVDVGRRD